ncbi:Chloroperoxidase [Cokeromyces recurvatus]|uniref:Chloroperoxidase n=1 Tax=Cokeromyces recurvatus TaxID=90255 RepID=UPI00221F47EF|nr:Chloroperoxidase [Cokeromyces recurvatus]KAI7906450.1 Chloroperoxidase [Cokeromyces recurvatus]
MPKSEKIKSPIFILQQNKIKGVILSTILGVIACFVVFYVIVVEIKGRRALKTPEEWKELLEKHPYKREESYARSPCPMVNTLANHGFISRDGRNIKLNDFFDALMLMGAPPIVTDFFLKYVYSTYKEVDPNASFLSQFGPLSTLDLDRLTIPGLIEHDASLTRHDLTRKPYNTSYPDPKFVYRIVKYTEYANKDTTPKDIFTRKDENDLRKLRWKETFRDNKFMHLKFFTQFAMSTECSLLMDIIGRDGHITVPHLQSFLLHERFPEDWYPRETSYSMKELATKPFMCWHGILKSNISLDVLDELD